MLCSTFSGIVHFKQCTHCEYIVYTRQGSGKNLGLLDLSIILHITSDVLSTLVILDNC